MPAIAEQQFPDSVDALNAPDMEQAAIQMWETRITTARSKWKTDFERMQDDMDFLAGYQWKAQEQMNEEAYTANLTMRAVNQKVASLYARDPKIKASLRKRMCYQLWDEKLETLALAIQRITLGAGTVEDMAIIEDYQQGQNQKALLEKIGETLECLYGWNLDRQEPEFKLQMKQLVRRAVVTGVAYARLLFQRSYYEPVASSATQISSYRLQQRMEEIQDRIRRGDLDIDSAEADSLRSLMASLGTMPEAEEKLVIDFPPSTSVIVDPCCRILKGFVGANWIAIEYMIPLDDANAFFGVDLASNSATALYDILNAGQDTTQITKRAAIGQKPLDDVRDAKVRIYEVIDKRTGCRHFQAEGWPAYLIPPEPLPPLSRFWPIMALVLNDVETDGDTKASIFPPSDVQLVKHAQKEWNRSRNELRKHRRSRRPCWVTMAGWLSDDDKLKFESYPSNGLIELKSLPPNGDITKAIMPLPMAPIDPMVYEVDSLQRDILLTIGLQEANLGPVSKGDTTATEASISEQSRVSATISNVDDLDDFLSNMARAGGELLLMESSKQHVIDVCGPGSVWPSQDTFLFTREIFLKVEAASMGRPNKALEIANFERLAPLLLQAGANPMSLIEEGVKRLDDQLQVSKFFPMLPQGMTTAQPTAGEVDQPSNGQEQSPQLGGPQEQAAGGMSLVTSPAQPPVQ